MKRSNSGEADDTVKINGAQDVDKNAAKMLLRVGLRRMNELLHSCRSHNSTFVVESVVFTCLHVILAMSSFVFDDVVLGVVRTAFVEVVSCCILERHSPSPQSLKDTAPRFHRCESCRIH